MEEKKQSKGLSITISPEVAEGVYSNLGIISHSSSEFIVDFVREMDDGFQVYQDFTEEVFHSRLSLGMQKTAKKLNCASLIDGKHIGRR
jgi:hypothetical protein